MTIPENQPDSFGEAALSPDPGHAFVDLLEAAPDADPTAARPTMRRLLEADGANVIVATFAPGQSLNDHRAAHPIAVQCLTGDLDFTVEGETRRLGPGVLVHVAARVMHRVDSPADGAGAVMLLQMLTAPRS